MAKNNIIASLDLGTSKTCCMIGEISSSLNIDILGYGIIATKGIKKGNITNIDSVVQSILKAVDLAEQMAGVSIDEVVLGVSGGNVSLLNNRGVVAIPRNDKEITPHDVERVLQAAKIMAIPYDREIIDIIPKEFIVDGCNGIKDPVGMVGTRLEVSACIIIGLLTVIQNLIRCVQKAGLSICSLVLKPLAIAENILTEDELEMGVAIVDVGAGTCEVAVFQEGCITNYDMIPIGGDFITNDIAIGLRIPFSQAEEIKSKYACAIATSASDEPDIEVQKIGDKKTIKISQKDLAVIVEPRVQEIIHLIQKCIDNFNLKSVIPAGIVITGGGLTHIKGSIDLAQYILKMPVRSGVISGYDDEQTFSVALGLLHYGVRHNLFKDQNVTKERSASSFFERAKHILREYF